MGRHNLVLNITIGQIRNNGNAYMYGLTIYLLQMLYGSTQVQSIIFCEETPIFTLGKFIHTYVSVIFCC
jgi:hypothetical protein